MKNVALCALLVITSISCTRPKNEGKMVYSVAYPDTITITQYIDTTMLFPISLYYSSGHKKAIRISPTEVPIWVKYDTSLLEVMPDVLSGIKYRFHPVEAGIYSLSFQLSEPSTEPKMHQFVVKVNEIGQRVFFASHPSYFKHWGYKHIFEYYKTIYKSVEDLIVLA